MARYQAICESNTFSLINGVAYCHSHAQAFYKGLNFEMCTDKCIPSH